MPRPKTSLFTRFLTGRKQPKASATRSRKPVRPRDVQRGRVYRWENEHVLPSFQTLLALQECRKLVRAAYFWHESPVASNVGWKPPEVTDGRGRRHACGSREVIKLPRWSRTVAIVLHECAHGMSGDGHGPDFVAAYVALLVQFTDLQDSALRDSLKRSGVRIAERAAR